MSDFDWASSTTDNSNPFDSPIPPSYADPSSAFGFAEPVNFSNDSAFFGEQPSAPLGGSAPTSLELFEPESDQTNFDSFLDEAPAQSPETLPFSPLTPAQPPLDFGSPISQSPVQSPVAPTKEDKKSAVSSAFGSIGKADLVERSSLLQLEFYFYFFLFFPIHFIIFYFCAFYHLFYFFPPKFFMIR